MEDEQLVRRALREYHQAKSWARLDLSEATIEAIEPVGPWQLVLRTIYEERGVRYDVQPNPGRASRGPRPDPWALPLEHPADARPGSEVSRAVEGVEVEMDCGICQKTGECSCPHCGGQGRVQSGDSSTRCRHCDGRGRTACGTCQASGTLYGTPTGWSRLGQAEYIRVLESAELPLDVFLDLQDGDDGGITLQVQEGSPIHELAFEGHGAHYRQSAKVDEQLARTARSMLDAPDIPPGTRARRQRLELRRVPAWRIRFASGKATLLFGTPPKAHPPRSLSTLAGKVASLLGSRA